MDDLWRLSALALSALIDTGRLSPVDLLEGCLERCRRIDPATNALVLIDEEGARKAAEQSHRRARAGKRLGPLDGLPLTVKDNIFVAGLPATWGSRLYRDFVPDQDEVPVARLRRGGAVIAGKTNTPEFAMAPVTENALFGVTRNPWRTDLTPGGSSGGAVASVAAGIFPLAVATDAGGSIRRPASYAGVVGFRPSNGRVPRVHGFPPLAGDFQVVGPIARSVNEVSLLFHAMAGPDSDDRASLAFPSSSANEGELGTLRILAVPEPDGRPIDADVVAAAEDAIAALADCGHRVVGGALPYDVEEVDDIWSILIAVGVRRVVDRFPDGVEKVDATLAEMAARAETIPAAEYLDVLDRVAALRRAFAAATADYDIVLTPTSAALPWPADRRFPQSVGGRKASPRAAAPFATFVNAVGHPAISVPGRPSADGLPIGVQFVGRFGEDERVLALARAFERARPWQDRWPIVALDAAEAPDAAS